MKKWLWIILLFVNANCIAQGLQDVDSLYEVKKEAKSEEQKIKATIGLAHAFLHNNLERCATFVLEADNLLESYSGDSSKAWVQKTKTEILDLLAGVYTIKGDVKAAIDYYDQSIRVKKEIDDKTGVAVTINNIGYLFLQQQEPYKAFGYFKNALGRLKKMNDSKGIGATTCNMGLAKFHLGEIDSSLHYYLKGVKYLEASNYIEMLPSSYNSIGSLLSRKGEYELAAEYYKKSMKISDRTKDKVTLARTYGKLATLNNEQGKQKEAIEYGQKGLKLAEEYGSVEAIADLTSILHSIYYSNRQYELALKYHKQNVKAMDSLSNTDNAKELAVKELTFQFDQKRMKDSIAAAREREITQLQYEQKVERQKIYTYTGVAGLLVALLFTLYIYKAYKQKNKLSLSLAEKNKEITDSITYAKRIQEAILPPEKDIKASLPESFVLYLPKDLVAGDFYWMETIGNNVIFAVADCTGHGVPGAMVSVVCHNALNRSVLEFGLYTPSKILDKTRELVIETFKKSNEEVKDGMDIALCNLNTKTKKLQFAGANNELVCVKQNKEIIQLKADRQPIGLYEQAKSFTEHEVQLEEGDTIYLYSDGYPDQFGGKNGKKFKYRPFRELLAEVSSKPTQQQIQLLENSFIEWRGEYEQIDDVCVMGVRV